VIEHSSLHVRINSWQTRKRVCLTWCSKIWAVALCSVLGALPSQTWADTGAAAEQKAKSPPAGSATRCLAEGGGFLRARLSGAIKAELDWRNEGTECSGATRPSGGIRMRFSHAFGDKGQRLVLVFGIPGLVEGVDARELKVNLTVILEGAGQFYGTRGDDKCTIEGLQQEAIAGIPLRERRYRIVARGFCTQPAREVAGEGALLVSRFDFAGRVDYSELDPTPDNTLANSR
jgi:hypothetical protein